MKKIPLLCVIFLLALSCNNNSTSNTEGSDKKSGASSSSGNNEISFKVNSDQVTTGGWNISRFRMNEQSPVVWLNITSDMHKEKRTINVNLNGDRPGTYNLGEGSALGGKSHGSYYPDFGDPATSYSFADGAFVITDVDTVNNLVNGTFSGTVKNRKGETLNITDGKITNGALKSGITTY